MSTIKIESPGTKNNEFFDSLLAHLFHLRLDSETKHILYGDLNIDNSPKKICKFN